tara:strand:- start:704 stop:961 length:258 start_codon:yes stop_codon:yes gene_type:complete
MDKKKIVDEINKMTKENHEDIFNIIKTYDIKHTKNNNGIFINISDITDDCLQEITKYIDFINANNSNIIEFEKKKEHSKQLLYEL